MTETVETAETPESLSLNLRVGFQDGWVVQTIDTAPDGTDPGAVVQVYINPDHPGSYEEFMALSSIFTAEFMRTVGVVMDKMIGDALAENPEALEGLSAAVVQTMQLQGFEKSDAEAVAEMGMPTGEGSPS